MARVTIGIPVYNGEAMIAECLDSILSQTFTDFTVLICDNASTDDTLQICRNYASRDPRIKLIEGKENIGHEANFRKAFSHCETEYFCWRADDDYTSENYLDIMIKALDARPDCDLAAPCVVTRLSPTEYTAQTSPAPFSRTASVHELSKALFEYHASSFYGLWRTAALRNIIETIWTAFPYAYSRDHLTVLRPMLNARVLACPATLFVQRTYSPPKGDGLRGTMSLTDRIARLERLMPPFRAVFENEVTATNYSPSDKRVLLKQRDAYTYQKLRASRLRIFRLKAKRLLGRLLGRYL